MDQTAEEIRYLEEAFIRDSFELGTLTLRPVTAGTGLVVDLMMSAFKEQIERLPLTTPGGSSPQEDYRNLIYSACLLYALSAPIKEVTQVSLVPEKTVHTITAFLQLDYFRPDQINETFSLVNQIGLQSKAGTAEPDGSAGKSPGTLIQ